MAAVCIINLEDIRTLAREQGEWLPSLAQREWLERAIMRHVVGTRDCLKASGPSRVELSSVHIARAIAGGESTVRFLPSAKLLHDVTLIVDWLAGLPDRDPGLAGKLRRVTFANALGMSHWWHSQLRKAADRKQARTIPADPIGAPVVLEETSLSPGWSWVWLKTPAARKAEGGAMGHCIGDGAYESLSSLEAILSLRDIDGVPHVTLHLGQMHILQAMAKGNNEVPMRYRAALDRVASIIGTRLLVKGDPGHRIHDGCHEREGNRFYVRCGLLHREAGPAAEFADGSRKWYRGGQLHREDGPAAEWADGSRAWYRDGQLHREGGPAVEGALGTKEWFCEGKRHREDGPAVEHVNGTKEWYRDGKLHHDNGPAIERANGAKDWYRDGQRHREDGPAVERANGNKEWFREGRKMRQGFRSKFRPAGLRLFAT